MSWKHLKHLLLSVFGKFSILPVTNVSRYFSDTLPQFDSCRFCPCFFCYLCATIPGIWVLELNRMHAYQDLAHKLDNSTELRRQQVLGDVEELGVSFFHSWLSVTLKFCYTEKGFFYVYLMLNYGISFVYMAKQDGFEKHYAPRWGYLLSRGQGHKRSYVDVVWSVWPIRTVKERCRLSRSKVMGKVKSLRADVQTVQQTGGQTWNNMPRVVRPRCIQCGVNLFGR